MNEHPHNQSARICFFTDESLAPPYDEGVRNLVSQVFAAAADNPNVLRLCCRGDGAQAEVVATNGLLSRSLMQSVRSFAPDVIFFIPAGAMTAGSLIRTQVLRFYGRGCPVVILSVQPKSLSVLGRTALTLFKPDLILTQSSLEADRMRDLGCRAKMVPAGVDLAKFAPVDDTTKAKLRTKHNVGVHDKVVLHVGHLRESRNIGIFKRIQAAENTRCIMIGSTRTQRDQDLISEMANAGVMIVSDYQPNIEEWYQLADLYVFPVTIADAAIQFPLSVLEALACNLPVVTTRFGGLVDILPETDGLTYADGDDELVSAVLAFDFGRSRSVRPLVEALSWHHVAELIMREVVSVLS